MGEFLPYARQTITEDDIQAVVDVLRSDWLTTGPAVEAFEHAIAGYTGSTHAVAVSSGTAALHAMMNAIGIGPGDEVIVPAMTFVATANAVVYCGGTPVFADVDADTLLIDVESVAACITPRTRAIIAVDYAGQPCDYDALAALAAAHGIRLLSDGCHALGGTYRGRQVGTLAELTAFSFHPVKHVTTAEGGMVTTSDEALAQRMREFRNHGIAKDHWQRENTGTWEYQMRTLGFNYRLNDLQCALGVSQLRSLPRWLERRRRLASVYDAALADAPHVVPLARASSREHAYHLYVVQFGDEGGTARAEAFARLRAAEIRANVHYLPVHLHPFYRETFGTQPGTCPNAERAYDRILSLPMYPSMRDEDVARVTDVLLQRG
ncbi:MAG: UDP-4-amino-4,6-dideoxy-N-acetyl-beta-L-altrosamine transaminase [Gemmatimonadota bacterium]